MRLSARVAEVILAVCVLAAVQGSSLGAQTDPDGEIEALRELAASKAFVSVQPRLNGDAVFSFASRNLPRPFDFRSAVRQEFGCELTGETAGEDHDGGTCRHAFRNHRGELDGWVRLAPLAMALQRAGAERVELDVTLYDWPSQRLENIGTWKETRTSGMAEYSFSFGPGSEMPPPLNVHLLSPESPPRPLVPFLLMLAVTGGIAVVLRRRAGKRAVSAVRTSAVSVPAASAPGVHAPAVRPPVIVWLSWIQLGAWLWWLLVLPPGRIAALVVSAPVQNEYLSLAAGALLFCVPPLVASTIALAVLRRVADPDSTLLGGMRGFLLRSLLQEVPGMLLTGFTLTGMALSAEFPSAPVMGGLLGLAAVVLVSMLAKQGGLRGLTLLEAKELQDRVAQMAAHSGVRLNGVVVFRHRDVPLAGAFANQRRRQILVSDRLIERLTKREVDAVIAHELGHLCRRRAAFPPKFYWAYLPFGFAFWVQLGPAGVFSGLEPAVALFALAAVFYAAQASRRRELDADAWAAAELADPHGVIAALARVGELNGQPGSWGRRQGLILSHPSLDRRALSLAARFGFSAPWALAIAADPDALERGTAAVPSHYAIDAPSRHGEVQFSKTAKAVHLLRTAWLFPGCLALLVSALTYAVFGPRGTGGVLPYTSAFLAGLPLALWIALHIASWWHGRFLDRMVRRIGPGLPAGAEGDFVGMLPGAVMEPILGFFSWDLGRLNLNGGRMAFTGEQARFVLRRSAISSMEAVAGPPGWRRKRGVLVRWHGGSFILQTVKGGSRRDAARLLNRLTGWWKSEGEAAPADDAAGEMALPEFPDLKRPARSPSPVRALLQALPLLFVVLLASAGASSLLSCDFGVCVLAALAAGILYVVAISPGLIAGGRKPSGAN